MILPSVMAHSIAVFRTCTSDLAAESLADERMLPMRGRAIAAKITITMMTAISSIRVKPFLSVFFIFQFCSFQLVFLYPHRALDTSISPSDRKLICYRLTFNLQRYYGAYLIHCNYFFQLFLDNSQTHRILMKRYPIKHALSAIKFYQT